MAMPTPTRLTPTSFEHFALFRNFSELRPTLATALRTATDIASIWMPRWLQENQLQLFRR
jgi:hypothetical protein